MKIGAAAPPQVLSCFKLDRNMPLCNENNVSISDDMEIAFIKMVIMSYGL